MGFGTVLTQFATQKKGIETVRKWCHSWKWFRISEAIESGRSAAW